jgi:hypothetical protein
VGQRLLVERPRVPDERRFDDTVERLRAVDDDLRALDDDLRALDDDLRAVDGDLRAAGFADRRPGTDL